MASRASLKLLKLARENDGSAQLELGKLYLVGGEGIAPNQDAALMWLSRAANQGLLDASLLIAQHMPPEPPEAAGVLLPHYEAAARAGNAIGALHAAKVWQARADAHAPVRLRHFLGLAAQAGNIEAQVMLARMLDQSGQADEVVVDSLLSQAAQAGSDDAVMTLAGKAWQRRDPQGLDAIRAAAQSGEAIWCYRLGIMLRENQPDAAQLTESARWLEKACEAGLAEARHEFGVMLAGLAASPLRRNYKRAARLLESALTDGLAEAGVALAKLHANPRFEGRNPAAAQEALSASARLGLIEAKFELGLGLLKPLLRSGNRNLDALLTCARWLHEAAVGGHSEAAVALQKVADSAPRHDADALEYQSSRIAAVAGRHEMLAMRMKLMAAFGLSKAEMLLIDPNAADQGFCVVLGNATGKGGRLVLIEDAGQRMLLDEAKRVLGGEGEVEAVEPYASRYRKLASLARRHDIDWGRFSG